MDFVFPTKMFPQWQCNNCLDEKERELNAVTARTLKEPVLRGIVEHTYRENPWPSAIMSTGYCPQRMPHFMGSVMRRLWEWEPAQHSGSSTPEAPIHSFSTSPTFTKPRSPCRLLLILQRRGSQLSAMRVLRCVMRWLSTALSSEWCAMSSVYCPLSPRTNRFKDFSQSATHRAKIASTGNNT